MVQAVSRLPLATDTKARCHVRPCEIYGRKNGAGTSFSPSTSVFPCQYPSTILILLYVLHLPGRQTDVSPGFSFENRGELDRKVLSFYCASEV